MKRWLGNTGSRSGCIRGKHLSATGVALPVPIERLEPRTLFAVSVPAGFQYAKYAPVDSLATSMAFAPDGRLFYSVKDTDVRVIKDGVPVSGSVVTLPAA